MTIKQARRTRTTEKELIGPAIVTLLKHADKNNNVSSEIFRASLLKMVNRNLTKLDKELLPSREIPRIKQTIMNLVSHRTLDKLGVAVYNGRHGTFKVRAKARKMAIQALADSYKE